MPGMLLNYIEHCERYELFTGYKSTKNLALYNNMGYTHFKEEIISANLKLIYLQKIHP